MRYAKAARQDVGYHTHVLTMEAFLTRGNAPLTLEGLGRLAVLVADRGWSLRRAAERFQCLSATAKRWINQYRAGLPVIDRSLRPPLSPNRVPCRTQRRIVALRVTCCGVSPDRLLPAPCPLQGRPGPGSVRDAEAGEY